MSKKRSMRYADNPVTHEQIQNYLDTLGQQIDYLLNPIQSAQVMLDFLDELRNQSTSITELNLSFAEELSAQHIYHVDLSELMDAVIKVYLIDDARLFAEQMIAEGREEMNENEIEDWRKVISQQPVLYLIVIMVLINVVATQLKNGDYPAWAWNSLSEPLVALTEVVESQERDQLLREISTTQRAAKPEKLIAGTMDVDKLAASLDLIRENLVEEDIEEIIQAMNEEYIELNDEHN